MGRDFIPSQAGGSLPGLQKRFKLGLGNHWDWATTTTAIATPTELNSLRL
ncbi:MAG: hypothetical protein F6J94_30985 [Moorea sp. SIO1F2]|nr:MULTISPECIES: hypothetical protein [Moorena]NET86141.1 hypothetical protein [Moorena sp. SIO1F2]NEO10815.1 hypothetical protein [Moorena sp. SIO3E8]NEO18208.1 hypothetical protein [Moorena sp. SIO4A5]NEO42362.1 hypothetical protein [Moorena sp. SIOASIH]NEQ57320.1 hypothetical protein [Moorena sp. SIO4A1]